MKQIRLDGFTNALNAATNIVITNHTNPDGDAMGSALALQAVLRQLGKTVDVIVPNPYPAFLHDLPGNDGVKIYDQGQSACNPLIEGADMIFHLDYNAYDRSADMEEALRAASATKVMIDHHLQPESWPDFIYSDTDMSSTCQMIYEFMDLYGWTEYLNQEIAKCLYTGIVTDTGSFKYATTTSRTHEIAARLLETGIKTQEIHNRLFDSQPVDRLTLLGLMLAQMEFYENRGVVLLYLSKAQCESNGYIKGITEGFVNYGLSIGSVTMSVFMREKDGLVNISLRSKGELDVNEIARTFFNGGGHKNAAGGRLNQTLPEVLEYVRTSLKLV